MDKKPGLDQILEGLRSVDEKVREKTKGDLFRLRHRAETLTTAEGLKAIRAAAEGFPFDRPDPDELAEYLVDVASKNPRPEYIPEVIASFEKLGDKAKWWALVLLTSLEDCQAAEAYMEILRAHAKAGRVPRLPVGPLERKPRHADVFFPDMFQCAEVPALLADVCRLGLAYIGADLLPAGVIEPHSGSFLAAYRAMEGELRREKGADGIAWTWEEAYSVRRYEAGLLLDMLGHFPADKTGPELRRALEFRDPKLKYFAIASLLRQGEPVAPGTIAEVSSHAEIRAWLHDQLQRRGMLTLIPERYRTQAALAESDMVHWLTYPTELGRVPDEIELMDMVPVDTGLPGGVYDYFLFRFRTQEPHWAAEKGWMGGVSGPFRRSDGPNTSALGDTFSTFDAWDSKEPRDHVGDIQELMERWRKHYGKR